MVFTTVSPVLSLNLGVDTSTRAQKGCSKGWVKVSVGCFSSRQQVWNFIFTAELRGL